MKEFALTIGGTPLLAPSTVPTGGLYETGQPALQGLVGLFFIIAIIIAFAFAVLAGIRWIISEGKKENIEAIKTQLTYVVIGLLVIFLAIFVVKLLGFTFSVPLIKETVQHECNKTNPLDCR